ncbi:alpha/beta-hydrolase [Atractiella rhizophila]|nr:alpha/beta-hydrolase [Atractiella rhizophila]
MAEGYISALTLISLTTVSLYTLTTFYSYLSRPSAPSPPPILSGELHTTKIAMPEDNLEEARERRAVFYVPEDVQKEKEKEKGEKPALLIYLHGSTENGEQSRSSTTRYEYDVQATILSKRSGKRGWIVAYPDGYKGYWNDLRRSNLPPQKDDVHDSLFLFRLIQHAIETYNVSPSHIFLTGFSNGGQMCLRLVQELGAVPHSASHPSSNKDDANPRIRAIALHSTTLPHHSNLRSPEPIAEDPEPKLCPIIMCNGTADPVTPYRGGETAFIGTFRSIGLLFGRRGRMRGVMDSAEEFALGWRRELKRLSSIGAQGEGHESAKLRRRERSCDIVQQKHRNQVYITEWYEEYLEEDELELGAGDRRSRSRSVISVDWERAELERRKEGKSLVKCIVVKGDGHNVALSSGGRRLPLVMGPQLQALNAPKAVMEFFDQFLD